MLKEGGPVDDDEDEDLPPLEAHEVRETPSGSVQDNSEKLLVTWSGLYMQADGGLAAGRLGASRGNKIRHLPLLCVASCTLATRGSPLEPAGSDGENREFGIGEAGSMAQLLEASAS